MKEWTLVGLLLVAFVGCGSEDDDDGKRQYTDANGATCTIGDDIITCTATPQQCLADETPCWTVNGLGMSPMQSCAGCCKGGGVSYDVSTCTQVVCSKNSDCGFAEATCKDGFCWSPVGCCG